MLCWICPECGRESPPAVRDCPACVGATVVASVPESLKQQLEMTAGILALARTFQDEPTVRLLASPPTPMLLAAASANGSAGDAGPTVQIAVAEPIVVDSMETVVRTLVESADVRAPHGFDPGPPEGTNGFHPSVELPDEAPATPVAAPAATVQVSPVEADSAALASSPVSDAIPAPAEPLPPVLADPIHTSDSAATAPAEEALAPSLSDPGDPNGGTLDLVNSVPEAAAPDPITATDSIPTESITSASADPAEFNASVLELATCVAEAQTSELALPLESVPPPAQVLADPADLDASIVELAGCIAEIQATEPPPPVELEPELIALANALEFHAILQLETIDQQRQVDNSCIRAIVESFFEQPQTPLLCQPASIVQPPAPMSSQRIPMPRPNIAPAVPPPAIAAASALSPQPLTLAGPYLPRELQSFVPSPPRAAKGARQGGRIPGWIVSCAVALLLFLGAGTMLQYFTGNSDAKASSVPVSQANGADTATVAPGEIHPLARFVEVTGLRVVADLKHRSQLHYIVVNHGSTQLAGVSLRIAVRSSVTGANDPPLFALTTVIPSLGAYQSKEYRVDLDGDVRSSVIPEWQNLRADFQVATHQ